MSIKDCIGRGVAAGLMDPERARLILREYDGVFDQMRQNMGHTQAEAEAARTVVGRATREAFEKRRKTQLQAAAVDRQLGRMADYKTIRGEANPHGFLVDMVSNRRGSRGQTLDGKYSAVRATLRGQMGEAVVAFRATVLGTRRNAIAERLGQQNKIELLNNTTREIFGETSNDPKARSMAQAWHKVSEQARTRFNAAGGHIGKLEDWGLPQGHDARRIRKAGYDRWRAEILPRLDMAKMGERFNDGIAFTAESLEVLLNDAFEAIRSNGHSRRDPVARTGSSLSNRRADHRFFAFKTADDWLAYSDRFGSGRDTFKVMMGHLDDMAMDIAMMEELGPNPNHTFAFLKDAAMNMAETSRDIDAPRRATKAQKTAQDMFDMLQGRSNIPHNETAAKVGSAIRNYSTSSLLGSAVISSVSDINMARVTAGFVGIGKLAPAKMMARIYRSPQLRNELAEAGMIFENAVDIGNAVARYEFEDMQFESAARLADFTIRSTGLGWLTEARKQAFGGAVMHTLATDWNSKTFGDLNPKAQRTLTDYGITKSDWELIRQADVYTTPKGLALLRPQEVEAVAGRAVADRYLEAIHSMQDFAVPSTDLKGRSAVLNSTKGGSISGELIRFGLQFKGFPITLLFTHVSRIVNEARAGRPGTALSYAGGFILGNTLLGAVAIQLKELAKGRDPKEMVNKEFWGAAFLQGGGVGIFGDFLFADHNRFGGGFGETLGGPGVGLASEVAKLTIGNITDGGDNVADDLIGFMRRWTPGGSNWYWRAAYEREVLDQIQQAIDPASSRSFRRKEQNARNRGTDYFYPPGSSVVTGEGQARAPNFGNALGG